MSAGTVTSSLILHLLANFPHRNDLDAASREIGRVRRTPFLIDWALGPGMQPHTQDWSLEPRHAVKNAR